MSQTRKCKYCKQEIDKNVTVCPHCQKKQGVGCLTSIIVSIMVFLFVFFGIGIGVSSCAGKMTSENPERNIDTSAKKSVVTTTTDLITTEIITTSTETTSTVLITTTSATTATTTVTTTVTTTTETTTIPETTTVTEPPTEPPTPAPTEPPATPPTETQETTLSPDMIKSVLELTISQNFPNYKIDYQEELNEYVISLWRDGIIEGATLAVSSGDRTSWDNMVTSLKEMCNSFKDSINTLDPDASITLEVLNNLNTENRLLVIFDGVVLYDYVDEQMK